MRVSKLVQYTLKYAVFKSSTQDQGIRFHNVLWQSTGLHLRSRQASDPSQIMGQDPQSNPGLRSINAPRQTAA